MTYLLDTDTCIYVIKRHPASVVNHLENEVDIRNVGVSSITEAELRFGAEKSNFGKRSLQALDTFLFALTTYPFGAAATPVYAQLRAELERSGTPIGPLDTLIAAHALSLGAILVTNNVHEFSRVPNLTLENWIDEQ